MLENQTWSDYQSRPKKEKKNRQTGACQSLISRAWEIWKCQDTRRNETFGEKKQEFMRVAFKNILRVAYLLWEYHIVQKELVLEHKPTAEIADVTCGSRY